MTARAASKAALYAGVAGPVVFTAGWLIGGALQGDAYQPGRDDISDLAADGAPWPGVMLIAQAVSGLLIIAFALRGVRPALLHDGYGRAGAWLLAVSALGLGNLSDVLFRLDCRAVDGCTTVSWHGIVHRVMSATVLTLVIAPLVLARAVPAAATLSQAAGALMFPLLWAMLALNGKSGGGYVQRAVALVAAAWVVALARQLIRQVEHRPPIP